jgi:MFS family permease
VSALTAVAGGLALMLAFLWHEARAASPIVLTLLLYFALAGAFFVLPFDLVHVQGYSATATGAAYLPFALLLGGLSPWAGCLADRFGARAPLVAGPLVTAAGFLLLGLPSVGGSYWRTFFPAMVVIGLGMAITVAPLTSTVMVAVDERDVGVASGVNNTVARVAALLAVAIVGLMALEVFGRTFSARLATLHLSPAVHRAVAAQSWNLGDVTVPASATAAERGAIGQAVGGAFVTAFRWVSVLAALLAAAGALAAALSVEAATWPASMARLPVSQLALYFEALGSAGSDRPLIVTSGTALLAPGRLGTRGRG